MPLSQPPKPKAAPSRASGPRLARDTDGNFPVVAIGASAGGLDACRKLMDAMPANIGMAFILVQHLDPTHESMMVDLLASHTAMKVLQAADGMLIEPDHLYVIPPGAYLSVGEGALRLSLPTAPHGARLPFDFLLQSLAEAFAARATGVILSGTGADGSLGLKAVKDKGGLVIAQDPKEAAYDGMPRSAVRTGAVDLVLAVAKIPQALVNHHQGKTPVVKPADKALTYAEPRALQKIIELLRTKNAHDFKLYKSGTLQRRIERRMAMVSIAPDDMERYLKVLRIDAKELDLLAKDLLINVTSFFRDAKVFDLLAKTVIPDLVRSHADDEPLRIWIAGCSTGEEAYSLTMLFREEITSAKRNIKLQVFASDVDADAVASAREGVYPDAIKSDVSAARLSRFFAKEDHGFRIMPELRSAVVFTVQDLLSDPPFSRLGLVSCRNLLIYLGAEAQAKLIASFHFALRPAGILLLGNAETIANADGRFETIAKAERLYRRIGHSRPAEFGFSKNSDDGLRAPARLGNSPAPSRQNALAELCRRLVVESFAPAAILINSKYECLYSLGPTDRYLRVAPGHPTHDLLAMAPQGLRSKLRSAIQQASAGKTRVAAGGGQVKRAAGLVEFTIDVRPVVSEGEQLMLVCFVDLPERVNRRGRPATSLDAPRIAELEQELEAARTELQGAIHNLEFSSEEQKAINEEALSVNEEFQSTNEELLTSKEELQSLNEELTALNTQLQETLERQRTTSNDLQNILYSTDVATLFLDTELNIRFFTPATKSLFNVIPGDIGRPLTDLNSLSADRDLPKDARRVLKNRAAIDREIETQNGVWFIRRILPYLTLDDGVEGVVITFTDISERKRIRSAMEAAKQQAEQANVAKSRFLAAASHDLRQPLQALVLLQGLLAKAVEGEKAKKFVARLDETLGAMTGMLNTLLDINQIDSGTVSAQIVSFPIGDLLDRLRDEFSYQAQAHHLALRAVPSGLSVKSDASLLEQMIRNLLSNALKYTKTGKVLLGCRRRKGMLSIEIWDTGIGIPEAELHAIFEEYHQIDNAARQRSRGLGLGLSIVQRLGILLGHRVTVRSQPGKGSVFAIEVEIAAKESAQQPGGHRHDSKDEAGARLGKPGTILVIEDDPELRELMEVFLKDEGYQPAAAHDGKSARALAARGKLKPDLILADFNLPNGQNGLEAAASLRGTFQWQIPVIILTGDISTGTIREIASQNCVRLSKPVKLDELAQTIHRLLAEPRPAAQARAARPSEANVTGQATIIVVDDDSAICEAVREVLEDEGYTVETYATGEAFLEAFHPGRQACLLIDAYLPGMNGLALLQHLAAVGHHLPAIMITGNSDVPMAVQAMKAGASDFIEKPIGRAELLASVERALEQARDTAKLLVWRNDAAKLIAALTLRQRQIMEMVLAGHPSKNIAADLGISQRTVENHRASIMKKTGSKSLPALARLTFAAVGNGAG